MTFIQNWDSMLVTKLIGLTKAIWDDRNTFLHGRTASKACLCLCQRVLQQVKQRYKPPPCIG
jgi:hypothetical protein